MSRQTTYELRVNFEKSSKSESLIVDSLISGGASPLSIVIEDLKGRRHVSCFVDTRTQADALKNHLRALKISGRIRTHRAAEWSSKWKTAWKPFALTQRFHVIPLWQKSRRIPAGRTPIYLETTSAFGTGLHETTRLTSELIEDLAGEFRTFLDVGTGTGILAIVAHHSGARRMLAFDIDPAAVKVARENLKVNQVRCTLRCADAQKSGIKERFDLVAANLVSHDLIQFRKSILALVKPGGKLIVSGVSLPNVRKLKQAFVSSELSLLKIRKAREWAAFLFERAKG